MKLSGEHHIPASRQSVWDALNDPEMLKACLPGCVALEKTSDTEMTATMTTKIGPVKATFKGAVTLSELDPPNSYTISGEGQGGPAGFASGAAKINLSDGEDGGTILNYDVDAKVGGKLAQIGSRLIDSVSKKLAAKFFENFVEKMAERGESEAAPDSSEGEAETTASAPQSTAPSTTSAAKRGMPTPVWVIGIIGAVAVLILWASGVF